MLKDHEITQGYNLFIDLLGLIQAYESYNYAGINERSDDVESDYENIHELAYQLVQDYGLDFLGNGFDDAKTVLELASDNLDSLDEYLDVYPEEATYLLNLVGGIKSNLGIMSNTMRDISVAIRKLHPSDLLKV